MTSSATVTTKSKASLAPYRFPIDLRIIGDRRLATLSGDALKLFLFYYWQQDLFRWTTIFIANDTLYKRCGLTRGETYLAQIELADAALLWYDRVPRGARYSNVPKGQA